MNFDELIVVIIVEKAFWVIPQLDSAPNRIIQLTQDIPSLNLPRNM